LKIMDSYKTQNLFIGSQRWRHHTEYICFHVIGRIFRGVYGLEMSCSGSGPILPVGLKTQCSASSRVNNEPDA